MAPTPARFRIRPLDLLLLAVPLAAVLHWLEFAGLWVFLASCVAIIPLAGLMGRATECLADRLGPGVGGLLNATFGNAAELIIALIALSKDRRDLVKASITGSIIGNVLLVLGAAILAGGFFHKRQVFNRTAAGLGSTLLALACIGLLIPTIYWYLPGFERLAPHATRVMPPQNLEEATRTLESLSEEIAVLLAAVYLLSLWFSLRTHQHLFAGPESESASHQESEWSPTVALLVLLAATAGVAVMSEFLVTSVEEAAQALGMNDVFIGVIVVAVVGNAAEHSTAVMVAIKNKMDLAVTIAVGSSIQVALFVAPVLVFASLFLGSQPLDLHFTLLEVVAVLIAIGVTALVCQDGEAHWMEGVLLLAVYAILGLAFYHLPAAHG